MDSVVQNSYAVSGRYVPVGTDIQNRLCKTIELVLYITTYHNDYMIESRVRRNGLLCRAILYWKTPGKIYQDRLGTNVEAKG